MHPTYGHSDLLKCGPPKAYITWKQLGLIVVSLMTEMMTDAPLTTFKLSHFPDNRQPLIEMAVREDD